MNDRGSITVEAAIVFPITILVMTILIQLIMMFPSEDLKIQKVDDILSQLDSLNYVYEKVGILSFDVPENPYSELIRSSQLFINETVESNLLEIFLVNELDKNDMILNEFTCHDDTISGEISWRRNFVFGLRKDFHVKFEKCLWLFGDNKSIYPNQTLTSYLLNNENEEKKILVYKTKGGQKYHLEGCFYLVRSTTDKSKIDTMTLYEAKHIHRLEPCKRCCKEDTWK